jgi:hypothetical protein
MLHRCVERTAALLCLSVLFACATGRDFPSSSLDSIALGTTRSEEVLAQLGKPQLTGATIANGESLESAAWYFAKATGGPPPSRSVTVQFWNGVAVGVYFNSTFAEDRTDFDATRVGQIVKGKTTVAEVKQLLGETAGRGIYPVLKNREDRALIYVFVESKGSAVGLKNLTVTYGSDEIVREVAFSSSTTAAADKSLKLSVPAGGIGNPVK